MELGFPIEDWVTTTQAVREAQAQGRRLEESDLRKRCRSTYGPQRRAIYISRDGLLTGCSPGEFPDDRGVWIIHRSAVQERLAERSRGPGNPAFRRINERDDIK